MGSLVIVRFCWHLSPSWQGQLRNLWKRQIFRWKCVVMTINAKVRGGGRRGDVVIILFIDWTESHKKPCKYSRTNKGHSLYIKILHIEQCLPQRDIMLPWVAAQSRETYHTFTKKAVNIIARTQGYTYQKDCPILQQRCATYVTQTILKQPNMLGNTKTWHRPVLRKGLLLAVLGSTFWED